MNSKAIKRQLLAAIAMVLVAAIALGSSTYAWFVASGTVKAEGLQVQAQAQGGILIKEFNNDAAKFNTVAHVNMEAAKVYPTSTPDLENWYHALSTNAEKSKSDATGSETYAAKEYTTLNEGELDSYRLVKSFAIRSATNDDISGAALAIKAVDVTGGSASENFDKAIRVGVKVSKGGASDANPAFYVYAPMTATGFTLAAGYAGGDAGLEEKTQPVAGDNLILANNTIPASDAGLVVDIYIWFEGEDPECKTSNVLGLDMDTLSVSVTFEQVEAV